MAAGLRNIGWRILGACPRSDGGAVAVGYDTLVRVDGSGSLLWSKSITDSRWVHGISALGDGGFVAAGLFPGGDSNLTVLRMDADGNTSCPALVNQNVATNDVTAAITPVTSAPVNGPITAKDGAAVMTRYPVDTTLCRGAAAYRLCMPLVFR